MAAEHKLELFVLDAGANCEANQHTLLTTNFSQIRNKYISTDKLLRYAALKHIGWSNIQDIKVIKCLLKYLNIFPVKNASISVNIQ